jgi:hypothetical protein
MIEMTCNLIQYGTLDNMGFWRFPNAIYSIKYIAFARYPPRSDTSQDGGLVDLLESRQLRALFSNTNCIVIYC